MNVGEATSLNITGFGDDAGKNGEILQSTGSKSQESIPKDMTSSDETDEGQKIRHGISCLGWIGICALFVVLTVSTAVTSYALASKANDKEDTANTGSIIDPTVSPSASSRKMVQSMDEHWQLIHEALQADPVTYATYLDEFPDHWGDVDGLAQYDTFAHPVKRAAAWSFEVGTPFPAEDEAVNRFALAVLYYSTTNSEDSWNRDQGWLAARHLCPNDDSESANDGWFGVTCAGLKVTELSLSDNGLTGDLPLALGLVSGLESLRLDGNELSGTISTNMFPTTLEFLYLQNNLLTGEIPTTFVDGDYNINVVSLHGNNFTGTWPSNYCPACPGCQPPISSFSIDCEEIACPVGCCAPDLHCH